MYLIFLKHSVHLKYDKFHWNTLYILNAINFSETPCIGVLYLSALGILNVALTYKNDLIHWFFLCQLEWVDKTCIP